MSTTTIENLEKRVTSLEKEVAELRQGQQSPRRFKDWRQAVGMFSGNEFMKRIDEAGRKIREADRQESAS